MKYSQWEPIYQRIIQDFGINEQDDIRSAKRLDFLLRHHTFTLSIGAVIPFIFDKEVIICGAGPSLEPSLRLHAEKIKDCTCIAADGATTALLNNNMIPEIIVSDLDGQLPDLLEANGDGSILLKKVENFQNAL